MITKITIDSAKPVGGKKAKVLSIIGCILAFVGVPLVVMGFFNVVPPIWMGVGVLLLIGLWIDIGIMKNIVRAEKSKNK